MRRALVGLQLTAFGAAAVLGWLTGPGVSLILRAFSVGGAALVCIGLVIMPLIYPQQREKTAVSKRRALRWSYIRWICGLTGLGIVVIVLVHTVLLSLI